MNRIGALALIEAVIPRAEEITRRIDKAASPTKARPVLVVSSDGVHTPPRPEGGRNSKRGAGKWREVKDFRIYLLGEKERIVQIASWHQIQDAARQRRHRVSQQAHLPRKAEVLLGMVVGRKREHHA